MDGRYSGCVSCRSESGCVEKGRVYVERKVEVGSKEQQWMDSHSLVKIDGETDTQSTWA